MGSGTFVVYVRGVENDIHAVLDAHFDRVAGAGVRAEPLAVLVRLIDACRRLFVREVAVLC